MQSKITLPSLAKYYVTRSTLAALLLVSHGAVERAPLAADEALVDHSNSAPEPDPEVAVVARNVNRGSIVFDNALLDRLFGKERARGAKPAGEDGENRGNSDTNALAQETNMALLAPNQVFTGRLHSNMPAGQRALLRFAEQGRRSLQVGDPATALRFFEKALGIGATEYLPYIYYYLAQSHFRLANYQAAREFRAVAETWLGEFPDWHVEIAKLAEKSSPAGEIFH